MQNFRHDDRCCWKVIISGTVVLIILFFKLTKSRSLNELKDVVVPDWIRLQLPAERVVIPRCSEVCNERTLSKVVRSVREILTLTKLRHFFDSLA